MAAVPTYDDKKYEMFVDEETASVFSGGRIPWIDADTWRTNGIDPTIFRRGELPMKRILLNNPMMVNNTDHSIALFYFAMAHRAHSVRGPPRYLITLTMAPTDVVKGLWDGSLKMYPEQETLAFTKTLTVENYPGVHDVVAREISVDDGEKLLETGYMLLERGYV